MKVKFIGFFILLLINQFSNAQRKFSLIASEEQFLKNNLLLLARHYNIDAAKAQTIQAKIWELPFFSGELNLINPTEGRVLDVAGGGQKAIAIQQILYLGNKKRNQVELSKINEQLAELDFQNLLRNLKYQLRQSFYTVYFNNKKIETTDLQISQISELVKAYAEQTKKGNVPLKELVRLQSLLISFRNERIEIISNTLQEQNTLKLILNETQDIVPVYDETNFIKYTKENLGTVEELTTIALENRPDYLLANKNIEYNEMNIKWQKSLAKPDLTVGLSYDQRGGAFNNQVNATFGIPLNLWNRNKGNIQLAGVILQQSKADKQNLTQRLQTEIATNLNKWKEAKINYQQLSITTIADFDEVYKGILLNFQKRNVSILEFTDFMESYNMMSLQLNELKKRVALTAEELNSILNYNTF